MIKKMFCLTTKYKADEFAAMAREQFLSEKRQASQASSAPPSAEKLA